MNLIIEHFIPEDEGIYKYNIINIEKRLKEKLEFSEE